MEPSSEQLAQATKLLRMMAAGPGQEFITDEQYFKHYDSAVDWAKKCIEDDGSCPHVFNMWGHHKTKPDDWILQPVMMGDWPPPEGKKFQAMQGLGVKFVQENPDYRLVNVVHISEGWAAHYRPEDAPDRVHLRKGLQTPSQREDKVEILIVTGLSMDMRYSGSQIEMRRDDADNFIGWGEDRGTRYDPKDVSDPRDNIDLLSLNIIMGYLAASKS
jgi:hypothetical protein